MSYLVSPSKGVDSTYFAAAHGEVSPDTSGAHAKVDVLDGFVKALEDDPVGTDSPQPSSTSGKDFSKLGALSDDLEDGEVFDDGSATSLRKRGAKICFFTYHGLACKRQAKDKCPNMHVISEDGGRQKVNTHWINRGLHQKACGLPLCPWRDGRPDPVRRLITGSDDSPSRGSEAGTKEDKVRPVSPAAETRKRRAHWDQPAVKTTIGLPLSYDDIDEDQNQEPVTKRTKVDYSDLYPIPPPAAVEEVAQSSSCVHVSQTAARTGATCFFWLHGKCRRETCPMKHALDDPPKMVEPPPGYVHHRPCGLKWCPGDGQAKKRRSRGDRARREQPERYFEDQGDTSDDIAEAIVPAREEQETWFLKVFE
ncbi:hypothetical protein LTR95_014022 [Oleoguttula sp. CCFEE 5521]